MSPPELEEALVRTSELLLSLIAFVSSHESL